MNNNPIQQLKGTLSIAEMSKRTGLSKQWLHHISKYDESEMLNLTLKTVFALKIGLGLDIINNLEQLNNQ